MNWMELLGLSGFEDFKQVELTELKELEQKNRGRVLRTGRRFVAAVLATAMLLPAAVNLSTEARAAEEKTYPAMATRRADGTSPDDPHIEIESNLVRNKNGAPIGTMELAIRVQSPMIPRTDALGDPITDINGDPVMDPRPVQSVSVNLAYNAQVLHPVSWKWTKGNDSASTTYDVTTDVDVYYDLILETQKDSRIQAAAAQTGIVEDPTAAGYDLASTAVENGDQGLLYFAARAFPPETFTEMTTIAVIRFAVEDAMMKHITLAKNGDKYDVLYDNVLMTDLVDLQQAMTSVSNFPLVEFAQQKDIEPAGDKADSLEPTLLFYSDAFTEMNYIPDYDATAANMTEQVTRPIDGANKQFNRPKTVQSPSVPTDWEKEILTFAHDETADTYSYTTNLIHTDNVKFTLVSKESFVKTGADEDETVLVYVDWDNKILGTQIVPKNTDVRGLVSDYVARNFIYHDSDDTTFNSDFDINDPAKMATATSRTAEDVVSSLARVDNYRGKYPATAPMGETATDSTVVGDKGNSYPLSNKLDYVFFKRPMAHTDLTAKPNKDDPMYSAASDPDGSKYKKAYDDWFFAKTEWSQKMADASAGGTGGGTGGGAATIDDAGGGSGTGGSTPAAATPYWDAEHPYAYGWAQCTKDNYEDVWTTLGMGELGSTAKSTETASLAYQTDTQKGYSGSDYTFDGYNGGYQDLSTGANTIASVTYDGDAAFAFADLEQGFSEDEVFLKAVYEPGEDLMNTSHQYSLISKPYYNKLNGLAAKDGGAYSVDVTFERAETFNGLRQGVARMREPYVRQDVTTDLRWEASDVPLVDHDLTNPSNDLTYVSKSNTAFTKVDIENVDIIATSLTLSARHNKVDYYVKEGYGANFVGGDERSINDSNRDLASGEQTLDNYNYYVKGESDETDIWHDAAYLTREGSRGFVLESTIHQFMKMATQVNRGEIDQVELENIITTETLFDANLYMAEGKAATDYNDLVNIVQYLLDAANLAETAHNNGDNTWWNVDHDWAELTYHQLQGYLIQRTTAGSTGGTINYPETPIAALTWCHLHASCAAATSNAPTTWDELIDAARNNPDYIDLMTQAAAENLTKLRKDRNGTTNANGEAFSSVADFKATVVAAVNALDTAAGGTPTNIWSWNDVQKQILIDQGDAAAAADDPDEVYWWYDGAKDGTIDTYAKYLAAVKDATDSDLKAPDGSQHARSAKLNQLEDAYDANKLKADASYAATDPAWVKGTENLAITDPAAPTDQQEGRPFASFDAFTDAAKNAYNVLKASNITNPDWYQFQFTILHYDDILLGNVALPMIPYGGSGAPAEYATYWWHNGGISIKNLTDLLTAANNAVNGNSGALDGFTDTDLYNPSYATGSSTAAGLGLRKDFAGAKFTSADIADLRNYAKSYSQIAVGNGMGERPSDPSKDWDTFQYYIIHNGMMPVVDADRDDEAPYYWWKNGGSAEKVDFTTFQSETDSAKRADALAAALLDAAFRATYNGNTVAWDDLTATAVESGRLVKAWAGTEAAFPGDFSTANELLTAADLTDLKDLAVKLMQARAGNAANPAPTFPAPTVSWETIQYALLNSGTYDSNPSAADGYWWKKADSKGSDPKEDFKKLHVLIEAVANVVGDGTAGADASAEIAALQAFMTPELLKNLGFTGPTDYTNPPTADELSWTDWSTLDFSDGVNSGGNTWDGMGDCWAKGHFELTWYQLQTLIWYCYLMPPAAAETECAQGNMNGGYTVTAPSWVSTITWPITSTASASLNMFSMNMMQASNAMLSATAPSATAPNEANTAKRLAVNAAVTSKRLEKDETLRDELAENGYADELIRQLAAMGYNVEGITAPTTKPSTSPEKDSTYQLSQDVEQKQPNNTTTTTDKGSNESTTNTTNTTTTSGTSTYKRNTDTVITNIDATVEASAETDEKTVVTSVVPKTVNTTEADDDNDSQASGTLTTTTKDVAGLSMSADDSDSLSAADPPTGAESVSLVRSLESVTDFRNPREGPPRFRASPQRSPWLLWQQNTASITLLGRRALA